MYKKTLTWIVIIFVGFAIGVATVSAQEKQTIKTIYIPLADHYAGIVAYEKYRGQMQKADYSIERMKSWPLLRAYFVSGEADVAYIIAPMAMDMFAQKPDFRWVSLLHRDGNALAINDLLNADVNLPKERLKRKPDAKVAQAFATAKKKLGRPSECAVPSLLATHTVVLYKYLKDHGKTMNLGFGSDKDVLAIEVAPPKSPSFIKKKNIRGIPASFEQSLPWAEVVETQGFGKLAWYSKDVLPWPHGHVECIAIATDKAVKNKREALKEVIYYLHKAGQDIEAARLKGGEDMIAIADMIRKHIPEHNQEAIIQSLRPDLNVINYRHLNVDKAGLALIMELAVEGGILKKAIDIDAFADESFATKITEIKADDISHDYTGSGDGISTRTQAAIQEQILTAEKWAAHPVIVDAVKKQNAKKMTLDEIKAIDRGWISGKQEDLALSLQTNTAGMFLRRKVEGNPQLYAEAFLCDQQGAVVGEYPQTSDYWQGDEKKFTESFNTGDGRTYVSPLVLDESTQSFTVQISIPVKDQDETIGVLILGLRNLN